MSSIIVHYQNLSLFIIGIISLFACISYDIGNNCEFIFSFLQKAIILYLGVDLFSNKQFDFFIHHIFTLLIGFYNYYYKIGYIENHIIIYTLLRTEISSIFLVLKYYIKKDSIFYNINNLIFIILFFKFRVFDYYYYIIDSNSSLYLLYEKNEISIRPIILFIGFYGLYFLNLYWALVMIKIIFKSIKKFIDSGYKLSHYLCSYIHAINIPITIYMYSYKFHEKNIFNLYGIILLSISSYIYHYDVYDQFTKNEIVEYLYPKNNSLYFINDVISIHIRSFLVLVTSYYDSNNHVFFVLTSSGLLHLLSIYLMVCNTLYCLTNTNYKKEIFFTISDITLVLALVPDVILIILNSNMEQGIPFLIVNIAMMFLLIIEPLYELNHFGFHILLIFQNYYGCMIHNNS
jgi:hypothetical protein